MLLSRESRYYLCYSLHRPGRPWDNAPAREGRTQLQRYVSSREASTLFLQSLQAFASSCNFSSKGSIAACQLLAAAKMFQRGACDTLALVSVALLLTNRYSTFLEALLRVWSIQNGDFCIHNCYTWVQLTVKLIIRYWLQVFAYGLVQIPLYAHRLDGRHRRRSS
jgi:hypothetical protein